MWECRVEAYVVGRTKVSPLDTPKKILDLRGLNEDFDFYINTIARRQWQCINAHEARVYLIQTPLHKSVAWMSWLGRRGCRWHIVQQFSLSDAAITRTAKHVAADLAIRYQEKW